MIFTAQVQFFAQSLCTNQAYLLRNFLLLALVHVSLLRLARAHLTVLSSDLVRVATLSSLGLSVVVYLQLATKH
jgi:hypothetical protein